MSEKENAEAEPQKGKKRVLPSLKESVQHIQEESRRGTNKRAARCYWAALAGQESYPPSLIGIG